MVHSIQHVEGVGAQYAEKLAKAGVATTFDLLLLCGTLEGRRSTSQITGIHESMLLKWAHMADLMRISGVGGQFAELLEASGVDNVNQLCARNAASLSYRMREVNKRRRLTRLNPSADVVSRWIDQARQLDAKVID